MPRSGTAPAWLQRWPAFLKEVEGKHTYPHRYKLRNSAASKDSALFSMKRAIDVLGAGSALIFFAPLFISIALVIKLTSPGPVLFSQNRYGYHNRLFRIYKFRTMHTHLGDRAGTRQATRHDPRVTRIGRLLRSTSLDELPQLLNVLKGDMSLVGPRPHVPGMLANGMLYEELVPYYFQRHTVRPGITGLAQVSGFRGDTTKAPHAIGRIDHDLNYIENWSPWMDVKIILKTCKREFLFGSGA
jgi:exopolysaccharide biosynthesis polyprenyl glycosylphosphotransferase